MEEDEQLSPISLIDWSTEKLPEGLKYAFTASQILNYESKFNQAKSIINQHTAGNSIIGFTPIPFSDAPILIGSQIGMITRIMRLYNLSEINVGSFMQSTGTGIVVSNFAKAAVGSLLKFIPIIGTAIGGAINAGVAGAITFSMGTALISCYNVLKAFHVTVNIFPNYLKSIWRRKKKKIMNGTNIAWLVNQELGNLLIF
jgi:uncharacterized protein (DUF697 family)